MTFSLIAVDRQEGEIGVGVHSHWFAVGSVVPRVRAGVGAAVSQSISDPALAVAMVDALEAASTPAAALAEAVSRSSAAAYRQLAVMDVRGLAAAYTGEGCVRVAGHEALPGLSVQGNMLASPRVLPAMSTAFNESTGSLGRRLLAALVAADEAGGDIRGRQSAAILVAPLGGDGWRLVVDLRVDDHGNPLEELRRLYDLSDAYTMAKTGDEHAAAQSADAAARCYRRASELAPGCAELLLWAGLAAVAAGRRIDGMRQIEDALSRQPQLRELLRRLGPDLAPAVPAVRAALGMTDEPDSGI